MSLRQSSGQTFSSVRLDKNVQLDPKQHVSDEAGAIRTARTLRDGEGSGTP
jgi:hypothetical protein